MIPNVWEINDKVYRGQLDMSSIISSEIFPAEALPKEELLKSLIYNPDKTEAHKEARRLLAKVGINPANLELPLGCSTGSALGCEVTEYWAKQLRDFGFKTTINVAAPGPPVAGDAAKNAGSGGSTLSISAVEAGVIISNRYIFNANWVTPSGARAPGGLRLTELYELALGTPDPAVRIKALHDAQRFVSNEDALDVLLGFWKWNIPVWGYVRGLFRFATMSEGSQNRYTWLDR
jgi:hypothetical protein